MSEHLRDPDLDRLIQALNSGNAAAPAGAATIDGDNDLELAFEPESVPVPAAPPAFPAAATPLAFAPAAGPTRMPRAGVAGVIAGVGGPAAAEEEGGARVAAPGGLMADLAPRTEVQAGEALAKLLGEAVRRGASDVLLLPGLPAVFRVDGRLKRNESPALEGDDIARLFEAQVAGRAGAEIGERGSADFSLSLPAAGAPDLGGAGGSGGGEWRFRVNLHRQRGKLTAALRLLPREVPTLASLHLPSSLAELVKPSRGLLLVCGPTGSGKSSTLAALIGEINRTRTAHIITIEDPVEYEHRPNRSLVEHVEVGRDARTFSEALRAAMRQDPDVILVGEMRDLETMSTAVTAAETGHLVLATLHSNDAVQAVHRIVDVFPPTQQAQIRQQLALSLNAIIAQQLVPRADGRGRVPAIEVMHASFPVRSHIRNDHLQKLYNEITLGKRLGMTSFEESLAQLVKEGAIDLEEARVRSSHPEELDTRLRG
jgi:twitching motility protein PilT